MKAYDDICVSIIIPIYNVERYLEKCLDTVVKQSHENIEVILVNDGSSDQSGAIAERYLVDRRIRLLHKKNGGLSDARNTGIDAATGEYVMFIDSDDYVTTDFVSAALSEARASAASIVCFRFTFVTEQGEYIRISSKKSRPLRTEFSNIEAIKDSFRLGGSLKVNAWNKLYKKSLFIDHEIRYPKGRLHEDNLTTYKLLYFSKKTIFIDKPLLYYRQRPGSIMQKKITKTDIRDRYGIINETASWLRKVLTQRDLHDIVRIYRRTTLAVLIVESIKKQQIHKLPLVIGNFLREKR